ncbi:Major Facilitator Superfamily protein [Variovorax sp. OV700]|nr:Major Facilitator Superfamily protein [Variovorax sp. OV700]
MLKWNFGADPTTLSLMWALFGAFGLVGNMLVNRFIDRAGAGRMVLLTSSLIALSLFLWPWAGTLPWLAAVLVPWGLGCFATNSAQQARLVGLAPALAPGSVALNSSGICIGQAVGAGLGGWLLANDAVAWMNWVGFALLLLAIGLSVTIERSRRAARSADPRKTGHAAAAHGCKIEGCANSGVRRLQAGSAPSTSENLFQ